VRRRFGPLIAERQLVSRGNAGVRLRVSLGQPRPDKRPGGDWECPFRIRGSGFALAESGYGVDSMQALTTALEGIRALLDETFGSVEWEEGAGFQRSIPISFGGAFSRRLERLVDRECKRHLRQLERRSSMRRGALGKKRGKSVPG
jgi:hypothetical protein